MKLVLAKLTITPTVFKFKPKQMKMSMNKKFNIFCYQAFGNLRLSIKSLPRFSCDLRHPSCCLGKLLLIPGTRIVSPFKMTPLAKVVTGFKSGGFTILNLLK